MRCSACGETDPALFHKGQRYCKPCRAVYNMLRKERAPVKREPVDEATRRAKQAEYMRLYRQRKRDGAPTDHPDNAATHGTSGSHEHPLSEQLEHLLRWKQQRE